MKTRKHVILYLALFIIFTGIYGCKNRNSEIEDSLMNTKDAMTYLKGLKGKWIAVLDSDQSKYGFEYILSARDGVIIERLRTDISSVRLKVE